MKNHLKGKKIILSVTGSIAAYKTAILTRLLIKAGAEVQILMTKAATEFITPLTLSTLSKRPVYSDVSNGESWNNHVELGLWADMMLIAPITATTLAKLANGICDTMVAATYLSGRCPVFFAPAMDLDMWHHPATQTNVRRLEEYGNYMIPVEHGELASGLVGAGRMAEPENIVSYLNNFIKNKEEIPTTFLNKKVVITAGPTYEAIDPVRFIGNRSSGKMGVALAIELAAQGAEVNLILGPSKLENPPNVNTIRVQSAQEMYECAKKYYPTMDIAILAAAVADYRAKTIADKKIKKKSDDMVIELERTPDIAQSLGQIKESHQINIGFALETNDELKNAKGKLKRKNFDFIVLNSLQDKGAGFAHDTNKITIVDRNNNIQKYELKTKTAVAKDIINHIVGLLNL